MMALAEKRCATSVDVQGVVEADRPEAYIPGDRRRALGTGRGMPVQVLGAGLFADISGFTPLTEALSEELGSHRASEVLTGHLNRVFHAVIAELDRYGGEVIYFAGDAITCWLDGDDGLRAIASGLAMRDAVARVGEIRTPRGAIHRLELKVSIAVGPAQRFVVGDPEIQLIDVLAGRIVDRLAAAEHLAEKGEVVIDEAARLSLEGKVAIAARRAGENGESGIGVVAGLLTDVDDSPSEFEERPLPEEISRQWLLPEVYERLCTGSGEFLAELRPAFPFFASFGGIDFESEADAREKLDEFVRSAQHVLASFGGNVLQLSLGDKGAYLYGVFGTPVAHEDDAARACAAAVEFLRLESVTAAREIRIGLTHGRLRSGTYGHARRRTFVCLGDPVNLAARLMSAAPAGGIYVSELVRRSAGEGFEWDQLPPLQLKGKSAPIAAFAVRGVSTRRSRRVIRYRLPVVGREAEMAVLMDGLVAARSGAGSIVGVSAEAGMGKSRLVAEFVRAARHQGALVAFGECQSFGTTSSYLVWREIWRTLLGVDERLPEADQVAALESALEAIEPGLSARAPLLDVVLGLTISDTELTRSFDSKLRKASLEALLVQCLRARAGSTSLLLVLEDCHWLDPLSRDLLVEVARVVAMLQVQVVIAYRPEAGSPSGLGLSQLRGLKELDLPALPDAEMASVVRSKLEQLLGEGSEAPPALLELITRRAQGNPFYAEELLNFLRSEEIDPTDERAVQNLDLPDSLHSLILGRIDALSESPRRTIKVASVVGRLFRAPVLPGIYEELGTLDDVRAYLGMLRLLDLVSLDREEDEAYLFKHVVTQEVAYESLPFALRARLHEQIGLYLEAHEPHAIEANLDLLAYHFWRSSDEDKKREYLRRAGDAAKAAYANSAAIDYFERLADLLTGGERAEILLTLGQVLELVGNWEQATAVELEALELARAAGDGVAVGWCETALAEVSRKQGRFDEAHAYLERARSAFEEAELMDGVGRVLHLSGTLAAQRGDNPAARESYEASLAIRERLGERGNMASVLSNLGIVAEYEGDYDRSRSFHEQALSLRTEIGDRWAIAVSLTNLGMIAVLQGRNQEARLHFEEAMRLNVEVGDAWMVAITHNNLGNATRGVGDVAAAMAHYADSLNAYQAYDDRWATAFLLEDIAQLAALSDAAEIAMELIGAADRLREEIGSPRSPALDEELERGLEPAASKLGEAEAALRRFEGHKRTLAESTSSALEFCTPG
jgi:class 3 adenylate cyclase/tetratricopeptide (TPR) repeat protein